MISARSDIYSLASVLYEMLAGQPPHMGGSAQQIIMKIITEEAQPVTKLRRSVPQNVETALAKALEKLPADRFESARQFADALGDRHFSLHGDGARGTAQDSARKLPVRALVAAALVLIATSGVVGWMLQPARMHPAAPITRFTIPVPAGHDMTGGFLPNLALSHDGRTLAYFVEGKLYLRRLDGDQPEALATFETGAVRSSRATASGCSCRTIPASGWTCGACPPLADPS